MRALKSINLSDGMVLLVITLSLEVKPGRTVEVVHGATKNQTWSMWQ